MLAAGTVRVDQWLSVSQATGDACTRGRYTWPARRCARRTRCRRDRVPLPLFVLVRVVTGIQGELPGVLHGPALAPLRLPGPGFIHIARGPGGCTAAALVIAGCAVAHPLVQVAQPC